jgi:PPM family protein phosphatase
LAIALRYAARSDVGLVRQNNQDSAYAGPHLLVVADGMGGHAGGDVASSLAIGELAPLDDESHGPDALEHLREAIMSAHRELLARVDEEPQLTGMGTTVTALLRTGGRLALAHIGDSRAYLRRENELIQITRDHTFVQTLVDGGRLSPDEAEQHPQRSVLMRVLSDVVEDVEPDLSMREARLNDRYLLCSDGLSGVVSHDTLAETLGAGADPGTTCEMLIKLARRGGAPDNVTCIVADVVAAGSPADVAPTVVGAASLPQHRGRSAGGATAGSAAERAAQLTRPAPSDDPSPEDPPPSRGRWILRRVIGGLLVIAVLLGGGFAGWQWMMRQYFVGDQRGSVAIFRGLPQDLGPLRLSTLDEVATDVPISDLPSYSRDRVHHGIVADTRSQAKDIVRTLREQAEACRAAEQPTNPTPTVSSTPTTGPGGVPTTGQPSGPGNPSTGPGSPDAAPSASASPTTDSGAPVDCEGLSP